MELTFFFSIDNYEKKGAGALTLMCKNGTLNARLKFYC